MKKIFGGLPLVFCLCCILPSVRAQTDQPTPSPAAQADSQSPGGKRAREFQGDDLGQVLRLLARQSKINLMIDEAIKGTVNVRLENTSAMEAIEALVRQFKLTMSKDEKGIYYLTPPDAVDATLDLLAKPETAVRIAAYMRNFYDALIKEGFTADEALQIVVSDPGAMVHALSPKHDVPTPK